MPAVLGRNGLERAIPIELNEKEKNELKECAAKLRDVISKAEKEFEGKF